MGKVECEGVRYEAVWVWEGSLGVRKSFVQRKQWFVRKRHAMTNGVVNSPATAVRRAVLQICAFFFLATPINR